MKTLFFTLTMIFFVYGFNLNAQDKFEIKTSHPRVVLSKEVELSLRFLFLENKDANNIQVSLRGVADKLLNETFELTNDKVNITKAKSSDLLYKISTLGMAFRIFEEDRYANKMIEYLAEVSRLSGWETMDPLITADLITISALGYDWLYYDLTFEVRESVRNCIVRNGLFPGLEMMKSKSVESNWITNNPQHELTYSSALVLGALAVADDFPDLNRKVIYQFLINNQEKLESLNFDQFKNENPETWQQEVNFLAMSLASVKQSLGHDFNISNLPNIKTFSKDYLAYTQSHGTENENLSVLDPSLLWFGKLYNQEEVNDFYMGNVKRFHLDNQGRKLNYMCLLWMI